MKKSYVSGLAVSFSVAVGLISGAVGFVSVAEAATYTKNEYVNRDKCYRVKKIPALVEYNTRGILVRSSSRSWVGNLRRSGSKVVDKYHDPVFIQTRRVLEDQHVTLIPTGC